MSWLKIDDGLFLHPKWVSIPPSARGLWITALSYCGKQMTDGAVPRALLSLLGGTEEDAEALVRVGLWEAGENGDYRFHDFAEYNVTKSEKTHLSEVRAEAGRTGGLRSGSVRRVLSQQSEAPLKQTRSKSKQTRTPEPVPVSPSPTPSPRSVLSLRSKTDDYDYPGCRSTPEEVAEAKSSSSSSLLGPSRKSPGEQGSQEAADRDQRQRWIEETLAAADADPERQHWRQALAVYTAASAPRDVVRYQHRILANWRAGDGAPPPPGQTRQPAHAIQAAFGAGQPPGAPPPPRILNRTEARLEQRMAEHRAFFAEMAAETVAREEARRGRPE